MKQNKWLRAVELYLATHRSAVELLMRRTFTPAPDSWRWRDDPRYENT